MGVNAFGLSVCLLNGFGITDSGRSDYISRGALVASMLHILSVDQAGQVLTAMDLTSYRPFSLVVITPFSEVHVWHWDGIRLRTGAGVDGPLVSSSFKLVEVSDRRRSVFLEMRPRTPGELECFHRSHLPEAGPHSVCMHREDAHTVSLSRVVVSRDRVAFYYAPGQPCTTPFNAPVFLARRPVPGMR